MTNIKKLIFNIKSRKIIEISKIILKEKYHEFEKYIYLFYDDKKKYTEEIFKHKEVFGNNTDNTNIYNSESLVMFISSSHNISISSL